MQTVHERRPEVGGISILRARGTVDVANAVEFSEALAGHIALADRAAEHPLLDMTETYLACPAAVRSLDRATGALAFSGRALPVVQPRPHARDALRTAGLPGIRVHATMASALEALEPLEAVETRVAPEACGDAVEIGDDRVEAGSGRDAPATRRRAGP
ncbi:STAS domain-containing protein [Streptomyces lasalocidi]